MKEIIFENVTFYVGQNQKENDELFKNIDGSATWFHLDSVSSSHIYCVNDGKKLTKEQIKKGAELVRSWSKKSDKVIYIKKNMLKRIGPGLVELLDEPNYA